MPKGVAPGLARVHEKDDEAYDVLTPSSFDIWASEETWRCSISNLEAVCALVLRRWIEQEGGVNLRIFCLFYFGWYCIELL